MESIKDVLSRLCLFYGVSNNRQLAEKIDVNYNTISTWIKRDSIPYEKLHNLVQNESISFDWLLTGKGEMLLKEKCSAAQQVSTNDTYQVKRLTCKVAAGVGNHVESIDEFETGEIMEISKLLFRSTPSSKLRAIQVDGYSMIPMLFPDSWVFFENGGEYKGEGLYVINRDNELMVKLLQIDPYGKLIIKSVNPSYESWAIDLESQIVFNIVGKVVRTVI